MSELAELIADQRWEAAAAHIERICRGVRAELKIKILLTSLQTAYNQGQRDEVNLMAMMAQAESE